MRRFYVSPKSRHSRSFSASFALSLSLGLLAAPAYAQTGVEAEFSIQRLAPAPGPRNYIVTRGARTDGEMTFSAGVLAHYGYLPLVVRTCITEMGESCDSEGARRFPDVKVVENIITADLMGSLTPTPRLQLGLRLPVTWLRGQGIRSDGVPEEEALNGFGLGDPEFEVKYRAHGGVNDPFVVGVAAFVTAPIGDLIAEGKYVGDSSPTAGGRVILDGSHGGFGYAVNLGGAYRNEARVGSASVGPEARYSAGVGYQVSPVFRPVLDVFGSSRFSSTSGENTLEVLGAVQIQPIGLPVVITAGAGTTLIEGIGVPNVRALLGATWVVERKDADDDGIDDNIDQCPTEPEDRDGYEDSDGCPDRDNDLDGLPDDADKCPSQAEDVDGFEDTDGCPELDNDKDGLPDTGDQCPGEPETRNNFRDEDGCPDESDVDNDGVPDDRDKCPQEPEDTDGFEDTDGCPDPDNDRDGILDDQDECVDEPETINEFEDTDGCPDEAPAPKRRR